MNMNPVHENTSVAAQTKGKTVSAGAAFFEQVNGRNETREVALRLDCVLGRKQIYSFHMLLLTP